MLRFIKWLLIIALPFGLLIAFHKPIINFLKNFIEKIKQKKSSLIPADAPVTEAETEVEKTEDEN